MVKKSITYTEAMNEIETIISQIEEGDLDVDLLSEKVKRVTELIRICKEKLYKTEEEVKKILSADNEEDQAGS